MDTGFDYKRFRPIGQNDETSCWAACLSWWLRALAGGRPFLSQNDLITRFDSMTEEDGTISPDSFIKIAATNEFQMQSASFSFDQVQEIKNTGLLPITDSPNIIVFSKFSLDMSSGGSGGQFGLHMNVVFDQRGPDGAKIVTAMEPAFPSPGRDGHRTGKYIKPSISHFLSSSIILCCAL